jgi:D-alanyl-D-alanine carboxypeptidase
MMSWPADWGKNFRLDELIDYFKFQPMNFAPGQKWSYSNSGYILLGAIIEKCTGVSYSQFLQEAIGKPLDMRSTWLELPGLIIPRRAEGYSKDSEGYQTAPYLNMTQPLAAGGIVSTVEDLASWDAALYCEKLINAENLRYAHTSINLPDGSSTHYGYGWSINKYDALEVIDHGGGIHGFVCHILRIPSKRIFAAVLMNSDSPSQSPEYLAFRGAFLALGLKYQEPEKVQVSEEEAMKFVGKYELEAGVALTISIKDGDLWLAWPDEDNPQKLITTGNNEFVISTNPLCKHKLVPDEAGTQWLIEARNQYNEVQFKAKKIESSVS